MKYTMKVFIEHGIYKVKDDDPEVYQLFGTDTLPTPYFKACPVADVLRKLKQRNPDKQVTLLAH